jgi:cytoskeletal protein CcmA (bactofilin family)
MSWKRSGGIKQFDGINNLNVNSVVTDEFVMREAYKGTFTISGELIVVDDCSLNANVHVKDSVTIGNSLYVNDRIYIGENDSERRFIDSTSQGLGINLENPVALLDISGSNDHIIHVYSDQPSVKSTLVQNVNKSQGVLLLDSSMGALQWVFPDTSANFIYDASNVEFTVDKDWIAKQALHVYGNTNVDGVLVVKQDTTIENDLYVLGKFSLDGGFNLNGDLSMNGNLSVGGISTFNNTINTEDIVINGSGGLYWKSVDETKPLLRIRNEDDDSETFVVDQNSLVVDNDLFITGNLIIKGTHNVSLETSVLNTDNIFINLQGTGAKKFYVNQSSISSGGEGLYIYNDPNGNASMQDGFVKISNMNQSKMSLRSTGNPNVVSLNFNELNDNGTSSGLLVLNNLNNGYSDTSDNYDIISSHRVSTVDVNSSLSNVNQIDTVSISGDNAQFTICNVEDLFVEDMSVSLIRVHTVNGDHIQVTDLSAQNMSIDGDATFYSDIIAQEYIRGNSLMLSGNAKFDKNIDVSGIINAKDIHLSGTLRVGDSVTIGSESKNDSLLVKNNITIGLDSVDLSYAMTISGDLSMNGTIYSNSADFNTAYVNNIVFDDTNGILDLSTNSIRVYYSDTVTTLSAERLSYLKNITSDVQAQISAIDSNLNLGADLSNNFTATNTFSGPTVFIGDVSGSTIDLSQNLFVQGNAVLSNAIITGELITQNTSVKFGGDLTLQGQVIQEKNTFSDQDTTDSDNTEYIQYLTKTGSSNLKLKNNIICEGETITRYKFLKNEGTFDKLKVNHIDNLGPNASDFFNAYSISGDSYFESNESTYGTFVKDTTTIGGVIECVQIKPTRLINLAGNVNIDICGEVFSSARFAKALRITNDNNDLLTLIDLNVSTLTVDDGATLANNMTISNTNISVNSPFTVNNEFTSTGRGTFESIISNNTINAETINVKYINFLTESNTISSVTSNTSFAVYRGQSSGTGSASSVQSGYGSGGLLIRQNGAAGDETRAMVYINNPQGSGYPTHYDDVFFIGVANASGTENKVAMVEKGKLITNIFESDFINTNQLDVSGNAAIYNNLDVSNNLTVDGVLTLSSKTTNGGILYTDNTGKVQQDGDFTYNGSILSAPELKTSNGKIDIGNSFYIQTLSSTKITAGNSIYIGTVPANAANNSVAHSHNNTFGSGCLNSISDSANNACRANVAIGTSAINKANKSYTSVAIGYEAFGNVVTLEENNTAIGHLAGGYITPASAIKNNTFLGAKTSFDKVTDVYHNSTAVGYEAKITASDQIVLGRSASVSSGVTATSVQIPGLSAGALYTDASGTIFNDTQITFSSGAVTAQSFNAQSDYRLKENIQTIADNEINVDKLRPVSYTLKSNQKPTLGFIAHEVQEHIPSAVTGEKDGESMQSVDYNQIIPILVKEIQDLKKRVAYLEQNQK